MAIHGVYWLAFAVLILVERILNLLITLNEIPIWNRPVVKSNKGLRP